MSETPQIGDSPFSAKNDRPLVTFALFAFNQERYIREAIEGAFSQTYSPLEIILSDDCSTDRTFEIMQEMASAYGGPHQIVVNRNEQNRGIGPHVGKVGLMAQGELIVVAAGDDISFPDRSQRCVEEWRTHGYGAVVLESDKIRIDETGGILEYCESRTLPPVSDLMGFSKRWHCFGSSSGAYHVDVFRRFPEVLTGVVHEDRVLTYRNRLLDGKFARIGEPLIRYRVGGVSSIDPQSLSRKRRKEWYLNLFYRELFDVSQAQCDVCFLLKGSEKERVLDVLLKKKILLYVKVFSLRLTNFFVFDLIRRIRGSCVAVLSKKR